MQKDEDVNFRTYGRLSKAKLMLSQDENKETKIFTKRPVVDKLNPERLYAVLITVAYFITNQLIAEIG